MLRETPQRIGADVTFPNVPVAIDSGVVRRLRVIEMHGAHIPEADSFFDYAQRRFQPIGFTKVIAGREGMRSIDTNAERQFGTCLHDRPEMFEAMADTLALTGSVLEQDPQLSETQTFAGQLQTEGANLERVGFRTTTRTAGMYDEIIDTECDCPLNLLTKRID